MNIVILIHTESYLLWSQKRSVLSNWWQLNFCFCNFNYRNISQTIWRNPPVKLDKYTWPLWPGKPSGDQVSIEYRVGGSANPGPAPRPHLTCWQLGDILAATAIDRFLLDLPSWEPKVLTQSNLLLDSNRHKFGCDSFFQLVRWGKSLGKKEIT